MRQKVETIEELLNGIASHEFVLPAIQREFVWQPDQICNLFDSLMQGYPFGEFMFWRIKPQNSGQYRWYDFVRNYHQRDQPHCPELGTINGQPLTAILDGQQRLTAFNIGLRGSMARKLPYKHWSNPEAFPRRILALDLLARPDPDESGNRFRFDFIDEDRLGLKNGCLWFKVADILRMEAGPDLFDWLLSYELGSQQQSTAFRTLSRLHQAVRGDPVVAYYEEKSQDIERVLSIFIRCNRGGTPLSYSDLLLSIAVSQWETLDARKEVHGLVDDLNRVRDGLRFNADFVLKAGLMLTDIAAVGFRVENFTHENMAILEQNWKQIRLTLLETAELIDSFGFDNRTVSAINALLPIAYYLYRDGTPRNFESSGQFRTDRAIIRGWLTRTILKESGIWGSGLDVLLTALREVIRESGPPFPAPELRRVMAQRGKTLDFVHEEIEDLADMKLGDRRMFALLTMLFPELESRDGADIDHVFPKSRFTPDRLRTAGVPDARIEDFRDQCNRIGNLQLLDRSVNNEKRAIMPAEWLNTHFQDSKSKQFYCDRHLLGNVPRNITEFEGFYDSRRIRLKGRIAELVNSV